MTFKVDAALLPMNGENGRPRANNACNQGAHDTCDRMAGGMVTAGGGDTYPCECPHHACIPDREEQPSR